MSNLNKTRDKVQTILTSKLGKIQLDRDGNFRIEYESTMANISVKESDDWTLIEVTSPIAFNSNHSSEIFEFCNLLNMTLEFGTVIYSYDPNGDSKQNMTIIKHVLLGNTLDPDELMNAVIAVIKTADDIDEVFVNKFGGQRYLDR